MTQRFPVAMLFRELRASRRRLAIYVGSIALGVAALVSINSFRENVETSIRGQARVLLGADLELRSRQPFTDSVQALLDSVAAAESPVASMTSFASMALAPRTGRTRLVDVRATSGGFPFYGTIETAPQGRWALLQEGRTAIVDSTVLVQLAVDVGDTLAIGESRFVILAALTRVPGEIGLRAAIGPRVYIPGRYVEETGLLRFGSRARFAALLKLDETALREFLDQHRESLRAADVRIDTASEREQDLTQSLALLARYLGLVGLIALLLGGIGVASAVHIYVKGKLETVAVLRCLGATQRTTFTVYLLHAALLGATGAVLGVLIGLLVQSLLPRLFAEFLPLDVQPAFAWKPVAAGIGIGVWVALVFALHPLLTVRNVAPLKALRTAYERKPRRASLAGLLTLGAVLGSVVLLSMWQAPRWPVGLGFAIGIVLTTAILWLLALFIMRATRMLLPRRAPFALRQGVSNLFRPQNQTIAVTLAVGFGVFLLATMYVVQHNLIDRLQVSSYPQRPNLFLFDIQRDQRPDVVGILQKHRVRPLDITPIVTARVASVNGQRVDALLQDSSRSRWPYTREYRHTYRDTTVASEVVVAGSWWNGRPAGPTDDPSESRISVEEDIARELDVGVGDGITWNVQGRLIETVVANIRRVDWARFETNFFVVFESGVLEDAPQSFVVLTRAPDARIRAEIQRDLVVAHPNISAFDLTLVQQTLDTVLGSVVLAIRFMALFSIGCGAVVLIGAVATSRFQRMRESVLLKTLGARARVIRQILMTEYIALGTLAALTGVALAGVAGWALTTIFFELSFRLPVLPLIGAWLIAVLVTTTVGLLGSWGVLRRPPLVVMREMAD